MSAERGAASTLLKDLAANPVLSQWFTVATDDRIVLQVGKAELGQGISTALAQIAADELDVELTQIAMVAPSTTGPDESFTAGSMSVFESGAAVRAACANVRALFVSAAARRWRVDERAVSVSSGVFTGPGPAHRASYGELVASVELDSAVDPEVRPKAVEAARVVGTSARRLDLPDKVSGRARFIHDLRLPGQLFGRVVRPPSPGASLSGLDLADVPLAGVTVVREGSFVGVLGADEAQVVRAAQTVRGAASWLEEQSLPDESALPAYLRAGPHESTVLRDCTTPPPRGRTLSATYSRPFLAHAAIGPSCAVARWETDGRLSVWTHSQGIYPLRGAIAQAMHLDAGLVSVTHLEGAGCYGHNGADDAALDAVLLARSCAPHPVQVVWSRADELTWSPLGSAMVADVHATLDQTGLVGSWTYDVWSQGHTSRPGSAESSGLLATASRDESRGLPAAVDPPQVNGGGTTRNALPIYDFPAQRIRGHRLLHSPLRSSALRALGAYMNVFAIESFMDELALAQGVDPLEFRLRQLGDERGRTVLEAAATAAGWGSGTLPEGRGRGIGFARYKDKGAYCAVVAEVAAESDIRVRRLTIAVDVGRVVNPDGVRNQIEGGATQSTSWTTKERVRFDRRHVTSGDWESYPILRFSEVPELDVVLVSRPDLPSVGAGEAAQGPTAAAIANAVTDAIGVRVRDLPLTYDAVVAAIEVADT